MTTTTLSASRAPFGIDRSAALLALRMALAAILAFSIAASLEVHNAYWAAMPVWVVAQSSRGLLLERGFYRLLGTIIGAAAGFAMLRFVTEPYLLLAVLGVWVGAGAAVPHLVSGTRSYAGLLAGMTAAVVVLPSIHSSADVVPLAIARVECTLIGVVVVTLVTGFFTPVARRADFYLRVRRLAADAVDFSGDALEGQPSADTSAAEQRLLAEMSNVDATVHAMAAGSPEGYRRLRHSTAFVAASLSMMAAASALRGRRLRGEAVPEDLIGRLRAMATSLRAAPRATPAALPAWTARDVWGPEARLHEAAQRLVAAESALFALERRDAGSKRYEDYFAPHRDKRRAVTGALVAGLSTFAAAAAALASGWGAGELAALGVCIFSMVLSTLPAPRMVGGKMILGVIVGVIAASFYRFVIQPHVQGPVEVIASVAPFILIGAFARVSPRTMNPALDANMCFMLGSQAGMPAVGSDFIINGGIALLLAALLVGGGYAIAPDGTATRLRALVAAIRRDLTRLLDGPRSQASAQWHARTGRRILRLLLDLQRAGRVGVTPPGLLATLNLGHAIAGLLDRAARLPEGSRERRQLDAVVADLRGFPEDPVAVAERALAAAEAVQDADTRQTMLDAASALRAGAGLLGPRLGFIDA